MSGSPNRFYWHHHFRTSVAQNHNRPFTVCRALKYDDEAPQLKGQQVTIVGQLCTPKDILAKQQIVEQLAVGDYLVFNHAGADAWNISHQNFLMHDKLQMFFLH
ncbi:MAG: hypothetical protein HRT38_20920 [Alteromonadaceae bacterium]|nr:hypothetical protein [Alteromonadaceae bacterium]